MLRGVSAGLFALGLLAGGALAGVTDFAGTWLHEGEDGFLKGLFGPGSEDIARVVITPQGVGAVRIHLYGRCNPECDWGSALAHVRYESPSSDAVRSLLAEFKTSSGIKLLTLRPGPGRGLRFELATDFTDHSGRHDYEANGSLRFQPAPAQAGAALSVAASTAPALAQEGAALAGEDCERINPEDLFMAPPDKRGGWVVRDYEHVILDFGSDKLAAAKAERVLAFYRFDEQCYIARPKPKMIYWRVAGQLPREVMKGADCVDILPDAISVQNGKVLSAARVVLDYGVDGVSAAKAASVLRNYAITRQCYGARPNEKMVYWLTR